MSQNNTQLTKLFIGGLCGKTTSNSLEAHFIRFGPIQEAVVIIDKRSGRSKGFGFVSFALLVTFVVLKVVIFRSKEMCKCETRRGHENSGLRPSLKSTCKHPSVEALALLKFSRLH